MTKPRIERIQTIHNQVKNNGKNLDSKAWGVARSTLIHIERDYEINGVESEEVDTIMRTVLAEAHDLSDGSKVNHARQYQER